MDITGIMTANKEGVMEQVMLKDQNLVNAKISGSEKAGGRSKVEMAWEIYRVACRLIWRFLSTVGFWIFLAVVAIIYIIGVILYFKLLGAIIVGILGLLGFSRRD